MTVYHGIVKGNVVVLPEGVHLREGTEVEVTPLLPAVQETEQSPEAIFKQRLVEKGLLKRVKTPTRTPPEGDRTPIVIEGTLSRAIIEDRR